MRLLGVLLGALYAGGTSGSTCSGGFNDSATICDCPLGWTGPTCSECVQVVVGDEPTTGYLTDGPDRYRNNASCRWNLVSNDKRNTISLDLQNIFTECNYDLVYIYEGDSIYAPKVASFSGLPPPKTITLNSPRALVHFASDLSSVRKGYNITYSWNICPNNCTGRGQCRDGTCECQFGYVGADCSTPGCPDECNKIIGRGVCADDGKACNCNEGYTGPDCSTSTKDPHWTVVSGVSLDTVYRASPQRRSSHAADVLGDSMWVFGGQAAGFVLSNQITRFDFKANSWNTVTVKGTSPSPRHSHTFTAIPKTQKLFMLGGMSADGTSNELWSFDTNTLTWDRLPNAPLAVSQHTAHYLKDGKLISVLGYASSVGFTPKIMLYDIAAARWDTQPTPFSYAPSLAGHTSVYLPNMDAVLVYGGVSPSSVLVTEPTNYTGLYYVGNNTWESLPGPGSKVYMHGSALIGQTMYTYGGNGYVSDESATGAARCFLSGLSAFDIANRRWHQVKEGSLTPGRRYGHSLVTYGGRLYLQGGFDGMLLMDTMVFAPGECQQHATEDACGTHGCQWCAGTSTCLLPDVAPTTCPMSPPIPPEAFSVPRTCADAYDCTTCNTIPECRWDDSVSPKNIRTKCTESRPYYASENPSNITGDQNSGFGTCPAPCETFDSCGTCLGNNLGLCVWCNSKKSCVPLNGYLTAYPYGGCTQFSYMDPQTCPSTNCSMNRDFNSCFTMAGCGWCQFKEETGLGACKEGSLNGPLDGKCPNEGTWYITKEPDCQCNGHSSCDAKTGECIGCRHNTTGSHCEQCMDGYFGDARNGGECKPCEKAFNSHACLACDRLTGACTNCSDGVAGDKCDQCATGFHGDAISGKCQPCDCNGQTDTCNSTTGVCHSCPPGVTGDRCERCLDKYIGDPSKPGGRCYFPLDVNTRYQVQLRDDVKRFFFIRPVREDTELNLTFLGISEYDPNKGGMLLNVTAVDLETNQRKTLAVGQSGDYTALLSPSEYKMSTLLLEVSVYTHGTLGDTVLFQIFYTQYPPAPNLVRFFMTFFACFACLLLLAGVVWKMRGMMLQRRALEQRQKELVEMAARPFASVSILTGDKGAKVQPISVEHLRDPKCAIATILILLPHHEDAKTHQYAFGSAIVSTAAGGGGDGEGGKAKRTRSGVVRKLSDLAARARL